MRARSNDKGSCFGSKVKINDRNGEMNSVDQRLNPSLKRKDKLNLMKTGGANNTEILIVLPRYCIFINGRFVATLCRTSLLAPLAHFLSVCHILENLTVSQAF